MRRALWVVRGKITTPRRDAAEVARLLGLARAAAPATAFAATQPPT